MEFHGITTKGGFDIAPGKPPCAEYDKCETGALSAGIRVHPARFFPFLLAAPKARPPSMMLWPSGGRWQSPSGKGPAQPSAVKIFVSSTAW
jgi:hypothetical protein